jgi:hypothetical protein
MWKVKLYYKDSQGEFVEYNLQCTDYDLANFEKDEKAVILSAVKMEG